MVPQIDKRWLGRLALLTAGVALCGLLATPTGAAELKDNGSSLNLVPGDAAFYSTMLRNKEQLDLLLKSKAWAKLHDMPAIKQGLKHFNEEWAKKDSPLNQIRTFIDTKENRDLLEVLGDAVSSEIFCYGGQSWGDFFALGQEALGAMQFAPYMALAGKARGLDANEAQGLAILQVLNSNRDKLKLPDLVIGFKLTKNKPAEEQLNRLEETLVGVIGLVPQLAPLKGKVKRTKVEKDEFLTIKLDGSMVPWEEIPFKKFEEKDGEFDPLVKKLKELTLTLSFGIKDGYLVISMGPAADHLTKFGGKGAPIADRPELGVLAKYAGKKITSISYSSKAMAQKLDGGAKQLDGWVDLAKTTLPESGLPEKQQAQIIKDVENLVRDLKKAYPKVGATVSFTFMNDRGYESFNYHHGEQPFLDGSKPLTILDQLGGKPILAFAGRSKSSLQYYKMMVKHIKIAWGHVDTILRDKFDSDADAKDKYDKATKALLPIIEKASDVTEKMIYPALADGQTAFVLDAKWTSKQWHKEMPETPKALPMLELGVLVGVSDASLLRKGMEEYRTLINEFLDKLSDLSDGNIPKVQLPEPESKKVDDGTLYFYSIPEEAGLDKQFLPNACLGEKFVALTLSSKHSQTLLSKKALKVDGGPLAARVDKPLASASCFDWVELVDALTPWVDHYAPQVIATAGGPTVEDNKKQVDEIIAQIKTVMDVMKCYKGTTSATYLEDGIVVTHAEEVIRDLK
jgi:hypothetical protein